jgi:hypothetical protein
MFGAEKLRGLPRQALHQGRYRVHAVGNVGKAVDFAFRGVDELGQGRMHGRSQLSRPATM